MDIPELASVTCGMGHEVREGLCQGADLLRLQTGKRCCKLLQQRFQQLLLAALLVANLLPSCVTGGEPNGARFGKVAEGVGSVQLHAFSLRHACRLGFGHL